MSDIFISYARSTEAQARQIAEALRALGYGVWRDDELPAHRAYSEVIEERLKAAKAVIAIWSAEAVKSHWVRAEANAALEAGTLVQLSLDGVLPPMPFSQIQCADMNGWTGGLETPGWRKVVDSIAELVGGGAATPTTAARAPLPLPTRPSIAVMPFANLSGDPEQEYFADGMVEEIVNALSRIRSIFVIGSGSTLSFKGRSVSPQDVGRQLVVRFVLEGSVRKAGGRVRIAVKLIDASDGAQIWAERFDDTLEDVFNLQDEVALAVAAKIEPTVLQAEIQRASRRPTEDMGSYDLVLRTAPLVFTFTKPNILRACEMLDRAVALDPGYGQAMAIAAWCHAQVAVNRWSDHSGAEFGKARNLARGALEASPDEASVLQLVAEALVVMGDSLETGLRLVDRGIALTPGSSFCWFSSGWIRVIAGQVDLGAEHLEASMRLDPLSMLRPFQLAFLGLARFDQGRFADAAALLEAAVQLSPSHPIAPLVLPACYAHLNQMDMARRSLEHRAALTSRPIAEEAIFAFRDLAHRKRFLDGIALAEARPNERAPGA